MQPQQISSQQHQQQMQPQQKIASQQQQLQQQAQQLFSNSIPNRQQQQQQQQPQNQVFLNQQRNALSQAQAMHQQQQPNVMSSSSSSQHEQLMAQQQQQQQQRLMNQQTNMAQQQPLQQQQQENMVPPKPSQDQQQEQPHQFILPSTMVPPSVLASMFPERRRQEKPSARKAHGHKGSAKHGRHGNKSRSTSGGSNSKNRSKSASGDLNYPQAIVEDLLKKRGITFVRVKADDAEYDAVPSALQLASFGTHLVRAVHTSDTELLSSLLNCGLSPNPCNQFRDSVVDLVCKRANEDIFLSLMEHGCDLQTVDGFGRTPLHHACWASTFCRPIVQAILDRDPIQLVMEDKHGQTPLEYVRAVLYGEWIEFLEESTFWKSGGVPTLQPPKDSRPDGTLSDPPNAISVNLAALVSSGSITPEQVHQMDEATRKTYNNNNDNSTAMGGKKK
jgi:hypothetical protein